MPWPISTCGITSVVWLDASMRMKALGANLPSVESGGCSGSLTARTGRSKANRKPPASAPLSRLRRETSDNLVATVMARSSRLRGRSRLLDGGADAHIGAATADVSCHRGVDVGIVRVGRRFEQRGRRHDLAGLAIAALDHFEIKPGLLHLGAGCRRADGLDGGDRAVLQRPDRQYAGAYRLAVDMHGAGATLRDATAEFCPGQAENVS